MASSDAREHADRVLYQKLAPWLLQTPSPTPPPPPAQASHGMQRHHWFEAASLGLLAIGAFALWLDRLWIGLFLLWFALRASHEAGRLYGVRQMSREWASAIVHEATHGR